MCNTLTVTGFFVPLLLSVPLVSNLQSPFSISDEISSSRLHETHKWKTVDFVFPSMELRQKAISSGMYVPENNLPLGLDVWGDRLFVTLPRWKTGIPATLATIPRNSSTNRSPLLKPYPSWIWHMPASGCDGMSSVFRISIDPCGRLWVLDSGLVEVTSNMKQICPPQLLVFDLQKDTLLWRYRLPEEQVKEGSLFSNIVVDVREGQCDDAYVYMTDVWRYGILVYHWKENRSWRISHPLFYPDPLACKYDVDGLTFRWTDGVFGLSLSPVDPETQDRTVYFHPMSSFREFAVPASILRNETAADANPEAFLAMGEPRYETKGQSSASSMDRRGVMFYNLVARDAVGCWNSRQPHGYVKNLQGIVEQNNVTLNFPNDLKVDNEQRQSVWLLSNRLPTYLYKSLDVNDYNFRIFTAYTDEATQGTVCDPNYIYISSDPDQDIGARLGCPY